MIIPKIFSGFELLAKDYARLYKSLYEDYLSLGNFTELMLYVYITR